MATTEAISLSKLFEELISHVAKIMPKEMIVKAKIFNQFLFNITHYIHPNGQKVNIFLTKRRSQMRKVLAVAVLGILLVSGIAVAREVVTRTVENSANNSTMVVNGTTVYTKVIPIGDAEYLGVSYHVYNPSGNTNITIQFEQDALGTVPGTEGAADGNYTIATGVTDIVTALTTESTWYTKALSVPGTAYGRFKITETAATPTQVQMRLHKTVN